MNVLKIKDANNSLEAAVIEWLNEQGQNYDNGVIGAYSDLMQGGCQSGIVSELINYTDTVAFYNERKTHISALLNEAISDSGMCVDQLFGDKWDFNDPLALDTQNQNLLAWFGFEESARNVMGRNGYDI